ncbi:MAG TPA: phosphoenolpyruvate synthase [Vicinamibacteria bacterium]|nr:phosphoenolpyruvate synthase [Vicinamibacteria bacterium]
MGQYVKTLSDVGMDDLAIVGGKNASLGEMIRHLRSAGVKVPGGFATHTEAFRAFLEATGLTALMGDKLDNLDVDDVQALGRVGREIREAVLAGELPQGVREEIADAYRRLDAGGQTPVAVRSSATAEDMPDASFAGQQETYLNVRGIDNVLLSVKMVFASLFNDRAIAYRVHRGFRHDEVSISAGVQRMVRSDLASSGVAFTLDTESGFRDVVFVTGSYGLGEALVQGSVNPDEFYLHKGNLEAGRPAVLSRTLGHKTSKVVYAESPVPGETVRWVSVDEADQHRFVLDDRELEEFGRTALLIEKHYGRPMDIEWAKDGIDGQIYIVQARPETVKSHGGQSLERYRIKARGKLLVEGRAVGQKVASGKARVIENVSGMSAVVAGEVLVTDMTDPDWEPVMKRAAAIVTNRGGRTCHAAIIARELGIPAVVGCSEATSAIGDGATVTVSCAEGDTGYVYDGVADFNIERIDLEAMPEIPLKVMMNVANPDRAFQFASLPHAGVGLARLEFVINNTIGIHPKALLEFEDLPDELKERIGERIAGYSDPVSFYVDKLTEGIAMLAAAFHPEPVIVRLSDFKSNEYAHLLGGDRYEPKEDNPMIGFRGASRYVSSFFAECFALECRAVKRVREDMGFTNVEVMIPFVRTVAEGKSVVDALGRCGLVRGENELRVIMMCEIPSNVILADAFLDHFDGFSIGSNDLTQLTLALDRDSALVAASFDERDPAVKALLHQAIQTCKRRGKYVGICGQGPSDFPDFAKWLLDEGIESVSLNPDTVVETWLFLAGTTADPRLTTPEEKS